MIAVILRVIYFSIFSILHLHKQLSRGVLSKRCSENMQQIYRITPMPKWDFNKVAKQLYWNHTWAWSFIKRQTSSTSSDNEWYNEWQRVIQRVTTSGTTSDNEWYNKWQRVTISANFSFLQIRQEPITTHPKENSLNIEEELWRRPIELRAETIP